MDLKDVPTCELVDELKVREGVEVWFDLKPHEGVAIGDMDEYIEGPCIILKIIDLPQYYSIS